MRSFIAGWRRGWVTLIGLLVLLMAPSPPTTIADPIEIKTHATKPPRNPCAQIQYRVQGMKAVATLTGTALLTTADGTKLAYPINFGGAPIPAEMRDVPVTDVLVSTHFMTPGSPEANRLLKDNSSAPKYHAVVIIDINDLAEADRPVPAEGDERPVCVTAFHRPCTRKAGCI